MAEKNREVLGVWDDWWDEDHTKTKPGDECAKVYLPVSRGKCPKGYRSFYQTVRDGDGKLLLRTRFCIKCINHVPCPKGKKCSLVLRKYRLRNGMVLSDFECGCK